jgi:signal recognition particle subunit SRP54
MPYTLNDFRKQIGELLKPGAKERFLESQNIQSWSDAEHEPHRFAAIIDAMTPAERELPSLINDHRLRRIATGAGVAPTVVRKLLTYHELLNQSFSRWKSSHRRF